MKINKIILENFGSYENTTIFNTSFKDKKNIILVGGKNGAGKTTLFTAMRLCLYGHMSLGYKNINSYYNKSIIKLINNNAKLSNPTISSISMEIEIKNGQGYDLYTLIRRWVLSDSLKEEFVVSKNNMLCEEEEVSNFERFILNLIPPELFNLYFFDGEKIADFFMNEGSNIRLKQAFLTMSGYDTLEIMRKNFKRISSNSETSDTILSMYLKNKEQLLIETNKHNKYKMDLEKCLIDISLCDSDIRSLEQNYVKSGGITQEELEEKLNVIKEEEKKREELNSKIKRIANDYIPFLMLKDKMTALNEQIEKETLNYKLSSFKDIISEANLVKNINSNYGEIGLEIMSELKSYAENTYGNDFEGILNISLNQSVHLINQINIINEFDVELISKIKKEIKSSIRKTGKIKKDLDNLSTESAQQYILKKSTILEEKNNLLKDQIELEKSVNKQYEIMNDIEVLYLKSKKLLEEELKKESINDISARAILMLDNLNEKLYLTQIEKVEEEFKSTIKKLIRKTKFIDDIKIDKDFNISIFRKETFSNSKLGEILNQYDEQKFKSIFGENAIKKLLKISNKKMYGELETYFSDKEGETKNIPIEIDRNSLSNGEKQIFIMALYYSLISICNNEIPFVIDTPFARIDTEHRFNIAKYFFNELKGQVFILSTNEEIEDSHIEIMKDKISEMYILENKDNEKTNVKNNQYFEVKNGI